MKSLFSLIAIVFLSFESNLNAISSLVSDIEFSTTTPSELPRSVLYKGTLNGTIKIRLYLKEQEHPCGGSTYFQGMYKYDKQEKWLLLEVTTDREQEKFCMVEDGFSGVLFLEKNEGSFHGNWISPDTKQQFKVELKKVNLDETNTEKLDEVLFDDLLYSKNDC